MLSSCENQIGR